MNASFRSLRTFCLLPLALSACFLGGCDTDSDSDSDSFSEPGEASEERTVATGLLQNGDFCTENMQCGSGRCDGPEGAQSCYSAIEYGGSCNENSDCVSGRCDGPEGAQTCHSAIDNGDACNENSDCMSGRCDGPEGAQTCHPEVANGGSCNEDSDCDSGRCDGPEGAQTCRAAVELGGYCNEASDCFSNICDPSTNKCTDVPVGYVSTGDECSDSSECASGYCTADQDGVNADAGICVRTIEAGNKRIDPAAWDTRLNEIEIAGCHNCYQPGNASGYQTYREVVRNIPALELDVRLCDGTWKVGHDGCGDNDRFYEKLEDYFTEIQRTLANDNYQFPIIVNLDFKNVLVSGQGGEGESMNALIANKFGDLVFSKNDLAEYNGLSTSQSFANSQWNHFRSKAQDNKDFWPTAIELRNRVIFVANHLTRSELDDMREYNNFFLGPALEFDSHVSGEISGYVADGQTVFANLAQDWGDCNGDLPGLVLEARMIGRCWDSDDSFALGTQWSYGSAIATDHDIEAQDVAYKIQRR